ncbi:hypothetical protein LTR94_028746, partial [Friedmanniomyces endolithicus]
PSKSLLTNAGLGEHQAAVDAAALVYFLRDRIAAEIPKLVAKLCPTAKNGMRQEDRANALADVDVRLAALKQEQAELQSHLEAASKAGTVAPDWLHLLPIGEIKSRDGRGPYHLRDAAKVVAASLVQAKGKLVLDENHATDLIAPKGGEAPARGWIVDLQARADGIWGRVKWTDAAISRGIWTEYRGVSPVILHQKDGTIDAVLRASLVNQPNLVGLTSLHMTSGRIAMDEIDKAIAEHLGIDPGKYLELKRDSVEFRDAIEPMRKRFAEEGVGVV